jgi:hypothetical protein
MQCWQEMVAVNSPDVELLCAQVGTGEEEMGTNGKVREQRKSKKEKGAKAKKQAKSPVKEMSHWTPVSRTSSDCSENSVTDASNAGKSPTTRSHEMPVSRTSSDGSEGSTNPVLGSAEILVLDAGSEGAGLSTLYLILLSFLSSPSFLATRQSAVDAILRHPAASFRAAD